MRVSIPILLLLVLPGCRASAPSRSASELPVLTRAAWGAAAPAGPMQRHVPRQITIHHTAGRHAPERPAVDKLRALQQFSQERSTLGDGRIKEPWADVPYHFYIAVDGTIAEGRSLRFAGDSNTRYDLRGQIQIVLEGNFEEEIAPDHYRFYMDAEFTCPAGASCTELHAQIAAGARIRYRFRHSPAPEAPLTLVQWEICDRAIAGSGLCTS